MKKPAEVCFYIGLLTELVIVVLDKSSYVIPIEGQLFRITFLLFLLKFICTDYDRRELLWVLIFAVAGLLCWHASGRNEILRLTIFAAACKGLDYRKILKTMLYVTAIGLGIVMLLAVFHVYGTMTITQDFDGAVSTRLVLGLGHPNSLHTMVAMLLLLYLYLDGGKLKYWMLALLFVGNGVLFLFTKCSMGALTLGVAILWTGLLNYRKEKMGKTEELSEAGITDLVPCKDREAYLCEGLFLAAVAFTALGAIFGGTSRIIQSLDYHFMTGRIATLWDFNFHEGTLSTWTPFGSRLNTYFFDLGWIRLVYWYGVIPAILVIAAVLLLFRTVREKKDARTLMFITIIVVYTSMEAHFISDYIGRNYLLILFAAFGVFRERRLRK